jgi:hypothetical protein
MLGYKINITQWPVTTNVFHIFNLSVNHRNSPVLCIIQDGTIVESFEVVDR